MSEEKKPREFLLKKKVHKTVDADFDAIEVNSEDECDPKDVEAVKILNYIRVIERAYATRLEEEIAELKAEINKLTNGDILSHESCAFKEVNAELTKTRDLLVEAREIITISRCRDFDWDLLQQWRGACFDFLSKLEGGK